MDRLCQTCFLEINEFSEKYYKKYCTGCAPNRAYDAYKIMEKKMNKCRMCNGFTMDILCKSCMKSNF